MELKASGRRVHTGEARFRLLMMPVPGDLRTVVDAARRGDRGALDDLVRLTYSGTYTLAYRLTGNEDDARDVVQDAYLRACRGLRRFRGDAQFTTWLYRITANCSANLLAKRARTRTELLADDAPVVDVQADHDPEGRVAGEDDRARVAGALAGLPWRLRQVIVLRDIYDLPHRTIASELGISEAAAKVRLHRARRRLREALAGEMGDSRRVGPAGAGASSAGGAGSAGGAAGVRDAGAIGGRGSAGSSRGAIQGQGREVQGGALDARAS